MSKPEVNQRIVHQACVSGIGDSSRRSRCASIAQLMEDGESAYEQMGEAREFYRATSHPRGGGDRSLLLTATRDDLKSLYSEQMVPATKTARKFYNLIKMSAKGNLCPFCGFGSVETLDHFLPKSRYSNYSILPLNLVPSCRDCNTIKAGNECTQDNISSHPYFEDADVVRDEWLRAEIVESENVIATFAALPPEHWPAQRARRIINHFDSFDLARRYGIQAATRFTAFAELIVGLEKGDNKPMLPLLLSAMHRAEVRATGINSWQTALLSAICRSGYFLEKGFRKFVQTP